MNKQDDNEADDFPPESVVVPIEEAIDLHTFSPRDIPIIVEEYLFQCHQHEMKEVRIIHGRGTGTQRAIVRSLLDKHPLVREFKDAPPEAGGWGATRVWLK
jgi:DNA-nicking Smr family endonuclease